jgi:hypothetical protein
MASSLFQPVRMVFAGQFDLELVISLKHEARQVDSHFNLDPITFSFRNDWQHDMARRIVILAMCKS